MKGFIVARQSDRALFTLNLTNLEKSASLTMWIKVANRSPWTPQGKQSSSKDYAIGTTLCEVTSRKQTATFSLKWQLLESDTVLKCIFCILCQPRHTSEKSGMSIFGTATGLAMLIHCDLLWLFEGWPFILKFDPGRIHMPKSPQRSTSISLLPVWYWSLNLLL
jgi:hypothetical protein